LVPIFLVDLALGAALVATIALATRRAHTATSVPGGRVLGWLLIGIPLPVAVGLQLFTPLSPALGEIAFIVGVGAFACGALLVLGSEDEDDSREGTDPGNPPWWPDFERDFRAYARRHPPRVLR
jgi:hypothetical protein